MRRIAALIAVTCVLLSSACTGMQSRSVQTPTQAQDRARTLLAEAGGLRKDARAYELLIQQKESEVATHRSVIEGLEAKRSELEQDIISVRSQRWEASGHKAEALDAVLAKYGDDKGVVQAQIDDRMAAVAELEKQIQSWRDYHATLLQQAEEIELEADQLKQYALELSKT